MKLYKSLSLLQINFFRNKFFKDNSYLLFISLLLLGASLFTQDSKNPDVKRKKYSEFLENYIQHAEEEFRLSLNDPTIGKKNEIILRDALSSKQYFFIYKKITGYPELIFWSTQRIIPDDRIIDSPDSLGFEALSNGYYFFQKRILSGHIIISLLPVKWNYVVTNNYLKNEFAEKAKLGKRFDISLNTDAPVRAKGGKALFSLKVINESGITAENKLTVWLRLLSFIPLLLFIHFGASRIYYKKGLLKAALFLVFLLFTLRLISYFFPFPVNLRQFELFDPAVYGSSVVLRSLGDLFLNALLFLWVINFIRNRISREKADAKLQKVSYKWLLFTAGVLAILIVTYLCGSVLRSLVADSQISFDVINFFTLDIYSVMGFIVLSCVSIGYYYFCRIVVFVLQNIFPDFNLVFFISVAAAGLFMLTLMIGRISGGFELYELLWLLVFLFCMRNDLSGYFSGAPIVSRTVFWLFFFSASVAAVIITENNSKELRSRQHYAELIAAKTDPMADVLLNTMLTGLRADMLATNFNLFYDENTATRFRNNLINNNLKGYSDKYDTKIMAYDKSEQALFNPEDVSYSTLNGIINTQAKPTAVKGLYYYDAGYDKLNYLARRVIRDYNNNLLGYVFIIMSPRNFEPDMLYPELFSRGRNNSIENSTEYAYAVYDKGKLIRSHNDYAFSTRYIPKDFRGEQFLTVSNNKSSELWYKAGAEKYVVISKEKKLLIELITLLSYLFCAFLLGNALSWLISLLLRSHWNLKRLKNEIQLTIRQQVHTTIILFTVVSFLVIGGATILFFISRSEKNIKETLSRTIRLVGNDLKSALTESDIKNTIFDNAQGVSPVATHEYIKRLAEVNGQDVNLYSTSGDLKASSIALPYTKGILSTKMDPHAFHRLNKEKAIQYFQKENIGKLEFVSNYIPVTDSAGTEIAYLNIPYFNSQTRLKEEISNFLVTIINLNAFIFLIAGIVSLIITNRITRSFSVISEKMKKINLGKRNEQIRWGRKDEIGELVKEYNKMLSKLDESAATLARNERESAWQEMAKQIAHEIKNPLTPMKLSMQFLQRSIEQGAPDIKELGAKVSATLVEQIDHLSNIAGEFSRFANIENAKPEIFNLNDALRSVKLLYEGDDKVLFEWDLAPEPVIIYADKTHVNRILTNLILNAIQSVAPGTTPFIKVNEKIIEDATEISITDNGSGISEDMKSKIFTPNFTTKSSGTGLGLAMCLRMAHRAGGDMRYETSSAGSTFFVTLPLGPRTQEENLPGTSEQGEA